MGQIRVGGFQGLGQAEALDLLSDFRTNHMGAQQLATFGVEHGLYKPFCLTDGQGLTVGLQVETPQTGTFYTNLGQTSTRRARIQFCSRSSGV